MNRTSRIVAFTKNISTRFVIAALALLFASAAAADTLTGRVIGVHDGDTIKVLVDRVQYNIRLAGIDAPELHQGFGRVSRNNLAAAVAGKTVNVEWYKKDRYGRLVGKVLLDGRDMNLEQVNAGLAWHYTEYTKEQTPDDRVLYASSENDARAKRMGLWRDPNPVPPWEWRKAQKQKRDKNPRKISG